MTVRMRDVIDAAVGKWPEILKRYGMEDRFLRKVHGPCPLCGGNDRFRFDNEGGTGSYFCSNCGAGYGFKLLTGFTGRAQADLVKEVAGMVGGMTALAWTPAPDMRKRIGWITHNLRAASEVPDVMAYLRGRGLKPSSHLYAIPSIRYYDEDRKLVGEFPAMVTGFQSPTGELLTYHLTHVKDGQKAPVSSPRKLLTPLAPLAGGALRLTRVYPHLGLAEGVETALAVMRDFRIPCWAAANAGMLEKFVLPEGVTSLTIFGDRDASFTGQRAAFALAHRLAAAGVPAEVKLPDQPGDFADLPQARTKETAP